MNETRYCHCGKILLKRQKKACSQLCQYELCRRRAKGKNEIEIICSNCGVSFLRKTYMLREKTRHYYCDVKCADQHKKILMLGNKNFDHSKEHYERLSQIMKDKWQNDEEFVKKMKKTGWHSFRTCSLGGKAAHLKPAILKRRKTLEEKYGVIHNFDIPGVRSSIHRKSHETMKRNGTYGKSKIEDAFYEVLCEVFGFGNVKRQVIVNKWAIDFKVDDVYVQFDGTYWHGLDRPICEIAELKNPRDAVIVKTYNRDIKQNAWFRNKDKKLVRVTDVEFPAMTADDVRTLIHG